MMVAVVVYLVGSMTAIADYNLLSMSLSWFCSIKGYCMSLATLNEEEEIFRCFISNWHSCRM